MSSTPDDASSTPFLRHGQSDNSYSAVAEDGASVEFARHKRREKAAGGLSSAFEEPEDEQDASSQPFIRKFDAFSDPLNDRNIPPRGRPLKSRSFANILFLIVVLVLVVALIAHIFHSPSTQGCSQGYCKATPGSSEDTPPRATTLNGTYIGKYAKKFDQDHFFGIPYAQAPVGNLRFRSPQTLSESFAGRTATEHRPFCLGSKARFRNFPQSEDCLFLNIIRPSSPRLDSKLPVVVYIHGGGYGNGGSWEPRYDYSQMVKQAMMIEKPIIGVTIGYRLGFWGFLGVEELVKSGDANAGLKDQRMALHWVRENIAAFGGDPGKVTIMGQSAGASSVGFHLLAWGGRDDRLFHRAILQSSGMIPWFSFSTDDRIRSAFLWILGKTRCANEADTLNCLRQLPAKSLSDIVAKQPFEWFPTIDGDIISEPPSQQLAKGKFVRVPILHGANTDEGTLFAGETLLPAGILRSGLDFSNFMESFLPRDVAQSIERLYPNDECVGCPWDMQCTQFKQLNASQYTSQFRRFAAYRGDSMFIAQRRLTCQTWAAAGLDAHCYRFEGRSWKARPEFGSTHGLDIEYVFNTFERGPEPWRDMARRMSRIWAGFIYNGKLDTDKDVAWPRYNSHDPKNYVFGRNGTFFVEPDTFRDEAIRFLNDHHADFHR